MAAGVGLEKSLIELVSQVHHKKELLEEGVVVNHQINMEIKMTILIARPQKLNQFMSNTLER